GWLVDHTSIARWVAKITWLSERADRLPFRPRRSIRTIDAVARDMLGIYAEALRDAGGRADPGDAS
ncbi:MAG: hypothetical protein JF605_21315, partial [Burkholderia sp.]|nr:hypothetical protein [Burkholderia sp.]